jgi:DNA-directed RNA polymerase specialized sigma24 family protein
LEYDRTRRLRGYLRQLVIRTCYDWHQRVQRQHRGTGESAVLALLDQIPAREDLIARLASMFDHEVLQRAVRRVQRRVKPTTWQAFQLQAIDGLSGKQTAEILGMKVGTVIAARCNVQQLIQQTVLRIERTHGGSDAPN